VHAWVGVLVALAAAVAVETVLASMAYRAHRRLPG